MIATGKQWVAGHRIFKVADSLNVYTSVDSGLSKDMLTNPRVSGVAKYLRVHKTMCCRTGSKLSPGTRRDCFNFLLFLKFPILDIPFWLCCK